MRAECEKLLDELTPEEQAKAEKAALTTAKFMWNFFIWGSFKAQITFGVCSLNN